MRDSMPACSLRTCASLRSATRRSNLTPIWITVRDAVAGGVGDVDRRGPCLAAWDRNSRVNCSASRSLPVPRARSVSARPGRWPVRTCICRTSSWISMRCMSMRPAGARVVTGARCGPRRPRMRCPADRRALQPRAVQRADRHRRLGIVISDRWNGYAHVDPTRRKVCWSHIHRDFRALLSVWG